MHVLYIIQSIYRIYISTKSPMPLFICFIFSFFCKYWANDKNRRENFPYVYLERNARSCQFESDPVTRVLITSIGKANQTHSFRHEIK